MIVYLLWMNAVAFQSMKENEIGESMDVCAVCAFAFAYKSFDNGNTGGNYWTGLPEIMTNYSLRRDQNTFAH